MNISKEEKNKLIQKGREEVIKHIQEYIILEEERAGGLFEKDVINKIMSELKKFKI